MPQTQVICTLEEIKNIYKDFLEQTSSDTRLDSIEIKIRQSAHGGRLCNINFKELFPEPKNELVLVFTLSDKEKEPSE